SNPYPVSDSEIDWDMLARWHEYCTAKGLKYDYVHQSAETLSDMLLGTSVNSRFRLLRGGVDGFSPVPPDCFGS
ncbi:hypothetical protein, partial [Profundibacter sp.]|uniref:hypothetical protein n=1 Tax=Profundibacter sp. TaxID=3101071 RepID=UPI003D119EFA